MTDQNFTDCMHDTLPESAPIDQMLVCTPNAPQAWVMLKFPVERETRTAVGENIEQLESFPASHRSTSVASVEVQLSNLLYKHECSMNVTENPYKRCKPYLCFSSLTCFAGHWRSTGQATGEAQVRLTW